MMRRALCGTVVVMVLVLESGILISKTSDG